MKQENKDIWKGIKNRRPGRPIYRWLLVCSTYHEGYRKIEEKNILMEGYISN